MAAETARERFDEAWPRIARMVKTSARAHGLRAHDVEDLTQAAGMVLWEWCLRGQPIHGRFILLHALRHHRKARTGRCTAGCELPMISLDEPPEPGETSLAAQVPDREPALRIDGATFTLADAAIDAPGAVSLLKSGVDAVTLARAWGVSRQRVAQLARRIGGLKLGEHWLFPKMSREDAAGMMRGRQPRAGQGMKRRGPSTRAGDGIRAVAAAGG